MAHDCKFVQMMIRPENITLMGDDNFQILLKECFNCESCTQWAVKAYPDDPADLLEEILRAYHRIPYSPRWFRTTAEVQLMSKTYLGEVFPRTVLFLNTGMAIAPDQEIPVGETEMYPYSEMEQIGMMPINLEGYPTLYILAAFADKTSPHCRMERIQR